jgi:hypothetical protein
MSPVSAVAGKQLYIKCPVAGYPIESIVWEKGKHRASFLLIPDRITKSFAYVYSIFPLRRKARLNRSSALIDPRNKRAMQFIANFIEFILREFYFRELIQFAIENRFEGQKCEIFISRETKYYYRVSQVFSNARGVPFNRAPKRCYQGT